jgi:glycosyltransferase involved in cell wall biosynthesis
MKKRIIISAYNIHNGGGEVLLKELLTSIDPNYAIHAFLDNRINIDSQLNNALSITRVKSSLIGRLKAELSIKKLSKTHSSLFCFGNLPPLIKSNIKTTIYLQNKYLISKKFVCWVDFKTVLRTLSEKIWFEIKKSRKYTYLVQTETMKQAFINNQGPKFNVEVFGFSPKIVSKNAKVKKSDNFLYIASDEPHKNHKKLIDAWVLLSKESMYPKLTLVINEGKVSKEIKKMSKKFNLNINLIHNIEREKIIGLYQESKALIYPSLMESFGLPLLEADNLGLPIIASEKDYVRDIISPVETFDPLSSKSILRAIKRFNKIDDPVEINSAENIFNIL